MTRAEREVLQEVIRQVERTRFLPKSYFDTFPHKRKIAKDLMWRGYIESSGKLGDCVVLTPAGQAILLLETS